MSVVLKFDDIPAGTATRVIVDSTPVAVVRIENEVYAIADTCSHANVSLSEGTVWCDEKQIECIRHGSAFSLVTGHPDTLPATQPVEVFDATVDNGSIVVSRRRSS